MRPQLHIVVSEDHRLLYSFMELYKEMHPLCEAVGPARRYADNCTFLEQDEASFLQYEWDFGFSMLNPVQLELAKLSYHQGWLRGFLHRQTERDPMSPIIMSAGGEWTHRLTQWCDISSATLLSYHDSLDRDYLTFTSKVDKVMLENVISGTDAYTEAARTFTRLSASALQSMVCTLPVLTRNLQPFEEAVDSHFAWVQALQAVRPRHL